MSTPAFTRRIAAVVTSVTAIAAIAAACTGGGNGDGTTVDTPTGNTPTTGPQVAFNGATPTDGQQLTPVPVNSELVVGENRFMIGLLSPDNKEITGAEVAFRFFKLDGEAQELRTEAQATPITLEKSFTRMSEDGTPETVSVGESGVYVATVRFDEAGPWGVEVTATVDGTTHNPIGLQLSVLDQGSTIAVGAPAPRSDTLTLDDVDDIAEIDTSNPPLPGMHTMTIAQAVTSGRPSIIVFATPAFCVSRICGPTKDIVDDLFEQYEGEVNFVHVEPYDLDRARSGEGLFPIPATEEWGLRSEPWVFVVDAEGNVAARFESVVTEDELKQALEPLLTE